MPRDSDTHRKLADRRGRSQTISFGTFLKKELILQAACSPVFQTGVSVPTPGGVPWDQPNNRWELFVPWVNSTPSGPETVTLAQLRWRVGRCGSCEYWNRLRKSSRIVVLCHCCRITSSRFTFLIPSRTSPKLYPWKAVHRREKG